MPIGLDGLGIALLVQELDQLLKGRIIESIRLDENKVLTIALAKPGPGYLRFLCDPAFPLIALGMDVARGRKSKQGPPPLPRFEEPLVGDTITKVEQIDLDRVIRITLGKQQASSYRLYFELTPPHPNAFLTDQRDTIMATLFKAGTRTRKRTLAHGEPYNPPSPQDKAHPFKVTSKDLRSLPWRKDDEALSKSINGIGPFLSKEITCRARYCGSLPRAFSEMIKAHRKADIDPSMFIISPLISKPKPWIGIAWYKSVAPWVGEQIPALSLNMAANVAMDMFISTSRLERRRATVARELTREIKRWKRMEEEAKQASVDKEIADRYRKFGEIIITHLKEIRKGATEAHLPDPYSKSQEQITIPLQPHLNPRANAEAYFKSARKSLRRTRLAHKNLKTAHTRLSELRRLIEELKSDDLTDERLGQIETQLMQAGTIASKSKAPVDEKAVRLGIKPRRYVVTDGWVVLVGRSAKENDILTHRYATPSDLWFHARQAQGSHVVLRKGRKKAQVSKQALIEAAGVAAYYSKARTSKHVPVSYTEKRYVRKARKGPPGLCIMLREKVIFVEPRLPPT